jgi:hypothetical protein
MTGACRATAPLPARMRSRNRAMRATRVAAVLAEAGAIAELRCRPGVSR